MLKRILSIFALWLAAFVHADEAGVRSFVDGVAQNIIQVVSNKKNSVSKVDSEILGIIKSSFDIEWMAKYTMGKNYKSLTEAQWREYKGLYQHYLLIVYSPILRKYDGQSYKITRVTSSTSRPSEYDCDVTIISPDNKPPISLRYHIKEVSEGRYLAMDMVVENISTIFSQRSEFSSIVQTKGIDGLFVEMRAGKLKSSNG
jgi:phospholipid transport system substrate-binding protein